jgi:hypothetical protein
MHPRQNRVFYNNNYIEYYTIMVWGSMYYVCVPLPYIPLPSWEGRKQPWWEVSVEAGERERASTSSLRLVNLTPCRVDQQCNITSNKDRPWQDNNYFIIYNIYMNLYPENSTYRCNNNNNNKVFFSRRCEGLTTLT